MSHYVNKLHFQTRTDSEPVALQLRKIISDRYQELVIQHIDRLCSQHVAEDEWVQIDRIEIDLGSVSLSDWETSLEKQFSSGFESELVKKIRQIPPAQRIESKQKAIQDLIINFLETGRLPLWADLDAINVNELFREFITSKESNLKTFLDAYRSNHLVWKRLAWQFDETVHDLIISAIPELKRLEETLLHWASQFRDSAESPTVFNAGSQSFLKPLRRFILTYAPQIWLQQNQLPLDSIKTIFAVELGPWLSPESSIEEIQDKLNLFSGSLGSGTETNTFIHTDQPLRSDMNTTATEKLNTPESYTVQCAGIVLVASYLKQFFIRLHLIENNEWTTTESVYKAIHLVRYLASGERQVPEYKLQFEKLICGLAINSPVPMDIEFTNEELTEADNLLQSVITNWNVLKNTSVQGLQETFLKRQGIVSLQEDGNWMIQLERKTVDVLLESIPWNYTGLSFPWNSYLIFTTW